MPIYNVTVAGVSEFRVRPATIAEQSELRRYPNTSPRVASIIVEADNEAAARHVAFLATHTDPDLRARVGTKHRGPRKSLVVFNEVMERV